MYQPITSHISEKYTITIGTNKTKREIYTEKSFDNFENLVDFLENEKKDVLANDFNKSNSSWISSEQCEENKLFKQEFFRTNGRVAILDFDGEISLNDCIKKFENINCYIYNSTNNGKNNVEKFRVLIPLSRKIKTMDEVKDFYKSLYLFVDSKADKNALTACWIMYAPQNWKSTNKGKGCNTKVKEISYKNFNGKDLDVDSILYAYRVKKKVYSEESFESKKIDLDKQKYCISSFIEEFKLVPSKLKLRHKAFYILGLNLKSIGLSDSNIYKTLKDLNYKDNDKNIESIMESLKEETINLNPNVFKDEYYYKYLMDKKILSNASETLEITIEKDEKISNVSEFKNNIFTSDGVNLLNSPTNSGKSYYVLNEYINYIDNDDFIVLLVPYVTLLMDFTSDDVYSLFGKDKFNEDLAKEKRIIVSTYDKFVNGFSYLLDLNKCHIFVDEAHNLYTSFEYRYETLNKLYNLLFNHQAYKKLILMSGTFNMNYLPNKFITNNIVVKRRENEIKECSILYVNSISDAILEKVIKNYNSSKDISQIIYINDKNKAKVLAQELEAKNIKTALLNSDTKEDDVSKEIYNNSVIPENISVLIMTKIGEEGLSFNNQIHSIHCFGKIDSTSAEQLGNRGRKSNPKLYIYTKNQDKYKPYILNRSYAELNKAYKQKMDLIDNDIKIDILQFKHRLKESFQDFIIWDEFSNKAEYITLIVSSDLYKLDKQNEFQFYDLYFKKKMENYGWQVNFLELETVTNLSLTINDEIEICNVINEYKKTIIFLGSKLNLDEICLCVHKKFPKYPLNKIVYIIQKYNLLSPYYFDDAIFKAIKESNRNHNRLESLSILIDIKKNGESRLEKWMYFNIKENTTYYSKEQSNLLSDYLKEIEKYDPRRGKISKQKFTKTIENYFRIEKFTKKVDGKAEQVINVIEKKPLPTREMRPLNIPCQSNSDRRNPITPELKF